MQIPGETVGQLDTEFEALSVQVVDHEVVLLGPHVAVALSATAAAETARRLAEAAALAASSDGQPNQASQTWSRDA